MRKCVGTDKKSLFFFLPSFNHGGAQNIAIKIANFFHSLDHYQVTLIALDCSGPLKQRTAAGLRVIDLGKKRLRTALYAIFKLLNTEKPDLVFSTIGYINIPVIAFCRFIGGIKVVVREANTPSQSLKNQALASFFRWAYRYFYQKTHAVVCQTKLIKTELLKQFDIHPDRLVCINNPVDSYDRLIASSCVYRYPGDGLRLVSAGRLCHQKGYDRLIKALAKVEFDFHLIILGEGDDRPSLQAYIDAHSLQTRISILPFVDQPWSYYAGADAYLLPSRWEGMSNAVLEALSCGTPVIATPESGGIQELQEKSCNTAIIIKDFGGPFIDAIKQVKIKKSQCASSSLLPVEYKSDYVMHCYRELFDLILDTKL